MNRENFISIPPGMDCSIQGQRSLYDKRALKINRQGGMMFSRDWAAKDWLKAGHPCEKERNDLWRKKKRYYFPIDKYIGQEKHDDNQI